MYRLLLMTLCLAGCKTAGERPDGAAAGSRGPAEEKPRFSARQLMDVCWPSDAKGPHGIVLTFFRTEAGGLKDVVFQAPEGASNSVGRCLLEVAWTFPWEPGTIPATLTVTPPLTRASGWQVLAYVRLLTRSQQAERGLVDVAPLVAACLQHGGARNLHYRVLSSPVRVSALSPASDGELRLTDDVTDSERCVRAVLGSMVLPSTRGYELDFENEAGRPPPAAASEVAAYFPPKGATLDAKLLDPERVRETMQLRRAEVAKCWDAALARRPGLAGGRTLRIRVGEDGRVQFATVMPNQSSAPTEASDYLLDRCLVEAIGAARFPNETGAPADTLYSWVFAAR